MGKMISVGNDIFDEFIKEDGYYVDKTELIYELAAGSRNKVTLFVTLKDVEGLTFDAALDVLKTRISGLCIRHACLGEDSRVDSTDRSTFPKLKNKEASLAEIKSSLDTLMRMMKAVYGRPVILLIDEYDVPLAKAAEAKNGDYYRQMLDVIRGIMSISLKTNEYLKFAVITGCPRISKESIFTGVNNFACYSVTSRRFSRYFGFTENEVAELGQKNRF